MPSALRQEVAEVETQLADVADTLHPMLSEFIRTEIGQQKTLDLAPVVLAAAFPEHDNGLYRERRIHLATALELLTIALDIHKLLLVSRAGNQEIDPDLAGGTVLAGDYCFSRAAALAARTENARVVAIFSELLQQLSEGNLRQIFSAEKGPFDEQRLLFHNGSLAGAVLAGLPADTAKATANFGAWSASLREGDNGLYDRDAIERKLAEAGVASFQQMRWREIVEQAA